MTRSLFAPLVIASALVSASCGRETVYIGQETINATVGTTATSPGTTGAFAYSGRAVHLIPSSEAGRVVLLTQLNAMALRFVLDGQTLALEPGQTQQVLYGSFTITTTVTSGDGALTGDDLSLNLRFTTTETLSTGSRTDTYATNFTGTLQ